MNPAQRVGVVAIAIGAEVLLAACSGPLAASGAGVKASTKSSSQVVKSSGQSTSQVTPSAFESCAASASPPANPASASPAAAASPSMVWVNDPLGVSLRSGPGANNRRLAVLPQGTSVSVLASQPDASGQIWHQVQWNSQTGWIDGAYVVTQPVRLLTGGGWGLLIPSSANVSSNSAGTVSEARLASDPDLPFLQVALGDYPVPPAPDLLTNIIAAVPQGQETMVVWNYTVAVPVSRVPLNMCGVKNRNRPDGGWPWMYTIDVKTSVRAYHFVFLTSQPDSEQLLQTVASISLN